MGRPHCNMCPQAVPGDGLCPATNELNQMPIKALKYFLQSRNVSIAAVSEKAELIALLERTSQQEPDSCDVCAESGGSLLICDGCMHGFHLTCAGLTESKLPDGDWFCPKCQAALAALSPAAAEEPAAPTRKRVKKKAPPVVEDLEEEEEHYSEKEEEHYSEKEEEDYEESSAKAKKPKKKAAKKAAPKEDKPSEKKRKDTPEDLPEALDDQQSAPEQSPKKRLKKKKDSSSKESVQVDSSSKKKKESVQVDSSSAAAPKDLIEQIKKAITEIISSHGESEELLTGRMVRKQVEQ